MIAFAGLDMVIKVAKWSFRMVFRFWWHVMRLVFGPIVRHLVIRLLLFLLVGAFGVPLAWSWAGTPSVSITIAAAVVAATALWWLFVSDLAHHLYPHPALSRIMRSGYPLVAYPLMRVWVGGWLSGVVVVTAALLVGIVPYFTNTIFSRRAM